MDFPTRRNGNEGKIEMKKFKNLVIGGIQSKIFNLILFMVLLLGVAVIPVVNWYSGMLSDLTEKTGRRQPIRKPKRRRPQR